MSLHVFKHIAFIFRARYNDCIAVIIVGGRGKKLVVSLRSLLYGIMSAAQSFVLVKRARCVTTSQT